MDDENVEQHVEVSESVKQATRFGWTDKDAWVAAGKDESSWVDADAFLERGREYNGYLRKDNEKLKGRLADVEKTLDEFRQHHEKVEQRAYDKLVGDLKAQRKQAILEGDSVKIVELEEQLEEVAAAKPTPAERKQAATETASKMSTADQEAFVAWAEANPWLERNPEAAQFALDVGAGLQGKVHGTEFLKRVERAVRTEYPDLFENPARKAASAVDSSGRGGGTRGGKKSYSDLPAEVRKECDRFCKQMVGGKPLMTQDQYVKEYFEGEEA